MSTRVKYVGLKPGQSTWAYEEQWVDLAICPEHGEVGFWKPSVTTCAYETCVTDGPGGPQMVTCGASLSKRGEFRIKAQPRVEPGDVLDVDDLNDPRSHRARIVRGHLERGVCRVVEDAPAKGDKAKGTKA